MSLLKEGLKGPAVERLQQRLDVAADGAFGPRTREAVRRWQKGQGLLADGLAGPDTLVALGLADLVEMRKGSRGPAVTRLQERLGIPADGEFGTGTRQAVIDLQRREGLETDGVVREATLKAAGLV